MRQKTERQTRSWRRGFQGASKSTRGLLPLALLATLISAAPAAVAADPEVPPPSAREQVLQLWKSGGASVKSAAGAALTGNDAQVRAYLDAGQKTAEELDLRAAALTLVTDAGPGVSEAASKALNGTSQELAAFMKDGWKAPFDDDQRVSAARATEAGGAGVREAGDAAMNGSMDSIRAFLTEGQYKQRDDDARVRVAQIEAGGGPATKRAAASALQAGMTEVRDFLTYGQHIARAQDQEHASISDLAQQTEDAATAADKARVSAEEQAQKAKNSAALAKKEAATAAAETLAAKNDATKAQDAARRAAESSRRAAAAAKAAISSARAANAAAQTAAASAANAATAALRASQAASDAWKSAASGKVNEEAAAKALKAAESAEKIANSLTAMIKTAIAAMNAINASLSAYEDMRSAAKSSEEAAGYEAQAGANAGQAKAAAAAARRHAEEAKRASQAAQGYAADAVNAATQARDAALSSAAHARKAAEAARRAADHAGDAQAAANQAKTNAEEAMKAAVAAGGALEKAKTIQATTRKGEADEIAARTALLVNEARDAKETADAVKTEIGRATQEALKLQTDFDALAAEAAKPDAQPAQIAANGRKMAMTALQIRGPWSRAAAEAALAGNDDAVLAYARTSWKQAAEEDEREAVDVIAKQSRHEDVRTAATNALKGTPTEVHAFLTGGQYQVAAADNRIEVSRIAEAGGTGVKEAAQKALNDANPKALDRFLTAGQHQARIEDYRVEGARLAEGGGPEVKAAAEAALASPDTHLITFIELGRHKADRRDQLNAAHVEQIQGIIATASANVARAYESAYHAANAAATAQNHSNEAAQHATKAGEYANQAAGYATQAKQAADRASVSANNALASAATARKAAAQAESSARKATNSAVAAQASYVTAQGYAASAFRAAEQARQSALNAGESALAAYAKHRATVVRFQTERYTKEQQDRLDGEMAEQEEVLKADEGDEDAANRFALIMFMSGQTNELPPGMSMMEYIHFKLDLLGMAPVIGEPADGINCLAYAVEGHLAKYGMGEASEKQAWRDAALSCAAMIPVGGWLASAAKGVKWADKFGVNVSGIFEGIGKFFRKKNPCGPKDSFPAGTQVLMGDGSKLPIEQVNEGDLVQAADPQSGVSGPRRVMARIYTPDDRDFTDLTISGKGAAGNITATDHHPFWSESRQAWKNAADLTAGEELRTYGGNDAKVEKVRHWKGLQAAYNLTVADLHSYFVVTGALPVLVHNCNNWTSTKNLDEHYASHGAEMGFDSQREYREAAVDLLCDCDGGRPGVLRKLGKDHEGRDVLRYFDPVTKEYGMKGKGGIITYYKLDGGITTFRAMPGIKWSPGDPSW